MRKEELKKLKRINATPTMMRMAKEENSYKNFVRCQSRGKLYMISIFVKEEMAAGRKEPLYEVYCNRDGKEYITRILTKNKTEKWSSAMVLNLGQIYYSWWKKEEAIWQNKESKAYMKKYFETKETGIYGLFEWQEKVRKEKREDAEKREQDPWNKDMKLVPKLPKKYKEWMDKEVMREHYIFYEYQDGKATTGYCTYCLKDVPVSKPRHNKKGTCTCCKKSIKYKVTSKIKTLVRESDYGEIIQKIPGGLVIRCFTQQIRYRIVNYEKNYRLPWYELNEVERIMMLDNGMTKKYFWGLYKNKRMRWIQEKGWQPRKRTLYYSLRTTLYKRNLTAIKKTILLKTSAIECWSKLPCSITEYLLYEKGNPAIEKLAKIKMFILAESLMEAYYDRDLIDQDATELTKMLKIDQSRLQRLGQIGGDVETLRWYQKEKEVNTIWPDGMMYDFAHNGVNPAAIFEIGKVKLSLVKAWNYLKKQREMSGESMHSLIRTWNDYMNMSEKAKFNVKNEMIYKPKDLIAAHKGVLMILQSGEMEKEAKELKKKWPKVEENLRDITKYEWSDAKYCIITPKSVLDIVKEGRILQHCVHTCDFYFDRIQRKETYLLFLRKKENPDIPWYTLEVEPSGNIRQKRTTGDNQNKDFEEAKVFLRKYQAQLTKKLTEEEKLLGKAADEARKKELEELRKNENKVWHGKLAGQLLADVLEQDFMAAVAY